MTWQLDGLRVEYCLSQPVEEHCRVQLSIVIMIIVIICNLIKMLIMGYIAWRRPSEPLITLGDAVASFSDDPDMTTKGNCLAGATRFQQDRATVSFPYHIAGSGDDCSGRSHFDLQPSSILIPPRFPIPFPVPFDAIGDFVAHFGPERFHDGEKHDDCFTCQHRTGGLRDWGEKTETYDPRARHWFNASSGLRWILFAIL